MREQSAVHCPKCGNKTTGKLFLVRGYCVMVCESCSVLVSKKYTVRRVR